MPPDADAVHVTGLPAVPLGQEAVMTSGCGAMVTSMLMLLDAPAESVTVASIE